MAGPRIRRAAPCVRRRGRCRQRQVGAHRRRTDQRRRPAAGPIIDITDATGAPASSPSSSARCAWPARSPRASATTAARSSFVLSSSVKQPVDGLATSNGLRPGVAMTAKTMADELGPARHPRQRPAARPRRHRPGPRARRDRRPGDKARREFESRIPLRRYGEPEEFGRAAAFLLSPAASYITGVMLPVDGGLIRSVWTADDGGHAPRSARPVRPLRRLTSWWSNWVR